MFPASRFAESRASHTDVRLTAPAQTLGQVILERAAGDFASAQRQTVPRGERPAGGRVDGEGFAGEVGRGLFVRRSGGVTHGFASGRRRGRRT